MVNTREKLDMKVKLKFIRELEKLYGSLVSVRIYIISGGRSGGRRFCQIKTITGMSIAKQYSKFKLEIKLSRILGKDETVDHIDGDKLNDRFSNLQLLSREANASKGATKRNQTFVLCAQCRVSFPLRPDQVKTRSKRSAGPFCSKTCTGKYSALLRSGLLPKKRLKFKVTYTEGC